MDIRPQSLFCLMLTLSGGLGFCPSKNGSATDWWIIYQQRSMPFFHYYVDSSSNSEVSYHHPEASDSALSRAVELILDGSLPQYFLYSYDLINIMRVSESLPRPTHSKWMQGILATNEGAQHGYWVLHNNFLFPAMKEGELQSPKSASWKMVTIGDSSEDLFYVCLSLENRESLLDAVKSILAGNPFIYHKKLIDLNLNNYFTKIKEKNHPFSSLASANIFMDCLTATDEAKRNRCMYQFQTQNAEPVQVYTRPRGLLQGGKRFCYNQQSSALFDFVGVPNPSPYSGISSNNMFVISDEMTSQQHGVVCFGQDVAASSDTVAVMICGKLPGLWRSMVQSSKLTNWGCPTHHSQENTAIQPIEHHQKPAHNGIPSPLSQSVSAQAKVPEVRRLRRDVTSVSEEQHDVASVSKERRDVTSVSEEKDSKTSGAKEQPSQSKQAGSTAHRRSKREAPSEAPDGAADRNTREFKHPKKKEVDFKKSQTGNEKFLRFEKKEDAGEEKSIAKLERYMDIKMPLEKPSREKAPPKTVVKIITGDELQHRVIGNKNQLIAIFCRKGCRYCASAEPEFHMLIDHFLKEDVEFYHVDVGEIEMPYSLEVTWTPYVRFKPRGVTELFPYLWQDFTGGEYDFRALYQFLDEHVERIKKTDKNSGNVDDALRQ